LGTCALLLESHGRPSWPARGFALRSWGMGSWRLRSNALPTRQASGRPGFDPRRVTRITSYCHDVSRIEPAEVALMRHDCSVLYALKVEVDELIDHTVVQETKDLRHGQAGGHAADERCTDGLSCEQGDAASIQGAIGKDLLVGGAVREILGGVRNLPYLGGRPCTRQRVQAHRSEIAVATSKPGLDHQRKAGLVERAPSKGVVQTAESQRGFDVLSPERAVEEPFVDSGAEAATLG